MICLYSSTNSKYAFIVITLMISVAANASLLDCSKSLGVGINVGLECASAEVMDSASPVYVLKETVPAAVPATNVVASGFQVNQSRSSGALPGSAPLIGLVCALLGVVLLRAKSCNTK